MSDLTAIVLIALTLLGEARNQPPDGQACLAHTVVNRMAISGWTTEEVLFQPHQYLVWERDKVAPKYGLRMRWLSCTVSGQFPHNPWCMEPVLMIGSPTDWWEVFGIAARVYFGEDPPEGCEGTTHYDNPKFWPDTNGEPPWASAMRFGACIGDHCFYANDKAWEGRMPIYEYECGNCHCRFDLRRPMSERDDAPCCPECRFIRPAIRVMTTPAVINVKGGATHAGRDIFPDVDGCAAGTCGYDG